MSFRIRFLHHIQMLKNQRRVVPCAPRWRPSTVGAKQILLSVADGYFLKHPTKTYTE